MGTFSKSFASLGGFVAGEKKVIEYARHCSRPFIFSASIPPSNAAAVLKALEILESDRKGSQDFLKTLSTCAADSKALEYRTAKA